MATIQASYTTSLTDSYEYPFNSCVADGNLYVCDRQNNLIKYYSIDSEDGSLSSLGSFGSSELSLPEDITTDGTYIYVADLGNDRCVVYDLAGNLVTTFQVGSYIQPSAIECDGANLYFAFKNEIVKTDLSGSEILSFGGDSVLNFPRGIKWHDGNLYIADTYNSKVKVYSDLGVFISSKSDLAINRPAGIEILGEEFIAVTDLVDATVIFIQLDSLEVSTTVGSFGSGNNNFNFPNGITENNGFLYIADSANDRIVTYSYEISTETDYAPEFTSSIKSLFPTGQWWALNEDSFIYKLWEGVGTFFSRAFFAIKQIDGWIVPDNKYFNKDAVEAWEKVYGIPANNDKSLDERKQTISQRMSFPGEVLARQSASYIQNELQLAGFDVYVTYNRFTASDVNPNMGKSLIRMGTSYSRMGATVANPNRFERREPESGYTELIANFLNPDRDADIFNYGLSSRMGVGIRMGVSTSRMASFVSTDREIQLRGTFFVHGETYPNIADVPLHRKKEFRELILKLKPAQMVGFLYINYI